MPNPYYETELREMTGCDQAVKDYVFSHPDSLKFMEIFENAVSFLLPKYAEEGKSALTMCFGCTGGQHRSVYAAQRVAGHIRERWGVKVRVIHREQAIEQTFNPTI